MKKRRILDQEIALLRLCLNQRVAMFKQTQNLQHVEPIHALVDCLCMLVKREGQLQAKAVKATKKKKK